MPRYCVEPHRGVQNQGFPVSARIFSLIPDEDCHEVDRAAILDLLGDAAEVKLEGRVLPVVRTRAAGISQAGSLTEKIRAWASATEAQDDPLLDCLAQLEEATPERIAASIVGRPRVVARNDTTHFLCLSDDSCASTTTTGVVTG